MLAPTGTIRASIAVKNIEALIDDGGDITLGAIGPIDCAATAADGLPIKELAVTEKGYEPKQISVEGGKPMMPLTKTFFSPAFGMLVDRFGVSWMVHVPGPQP